MNKTVQENYHFKTMNMNWVKVLLKHLHLILCTKNCLKIRIGVLHNASKDKIGKKNKYIRTIRARTQKRTHTQTHIHTHSRHRALAYALTRVYTAAWWQWWGVIGVGEETGFLGRTGVFFSAAGVQLCFAIAKDRHLWFM